METFLRIIKLGYNNFWRNRWLTLGATLLMALTLVMISASVLITFMIRDTADAVRSTINLTVYFRDDSVTDDKITALADRIRKQPDVETIRFINKKQALTIFKRLTTVNEAVKKPITDEFNPLPRSVEIGTSNPEKLNDLVVNIQKVDTEKIVCSECVSYAKNKEIVDRLISQTKAAQGAGWVLSIFFGLIAIFNVFNIIRLTISARSDEIEIMRYVGASNMFTRGPFVVEGILYGLLGTIATTIFLPLLAWIFTSSQGTKGVPAFSDAFSAIDTNLYQYTLDHLWVLIAIQLVVGVLLGVIVSVISIRRYLKA